MTDSKNRRRKIIGIVAGVASAGLLFGAAAAYWTGGGAGTGSATTAANAAPLVVAQTVSTGLMPGSSVALAGTITNPNPTDIKAGTLTATVASVTGGANLADFSITGNGALIDTIVPGNGSLPWSGMRLVYANSSVNQDNGKNVTVTVTYVLTPFVENVLPPLGTYRIITVNGAPTFDIYVHVVTTVGTVIQPGDTLSTYDFNVTVGNPAWTDNLATADASGNIRYTGPAIAGHQYQITIKRAGSMVASFTARLQA